MATRSFIARYDLDKNEYTAIYCHWDGYPEGVGFTLRDHYTDDFKVQMLVNSNGISSLRENVADCPPVGGRADDPSIIFKHFSQMAEHYRGMWCEYGYVWNNNRWECYDLAPREINLYKLESANV